MKGSELYKKVKIKYTEIVDQDGKEIKNVKGIATYKDSLLVYTENGIYSDNPNVFTNITKIQKITYK